MPRVGTANAFERTGMLPPAPPGYTYEPNTGRMIPLAGSATDVLAQRTRQQQLEDEARSRTVSWATDDRNARDALRTRLMGMLDRPTETSTFGGGGAAWAGAGAGGSVGPLPAFNPGAFMTPSVASPAAPSTIGTIDVPDTSTAQANLFARAKDKVGLQTSGSLASLRSALAGRGMLGGGAEVRGAQNILTAGQGQLGETTREQAIQEGNRLTDFAKAGYEGAITQRGQDITARGQDLSSQEAARDAALKAAQVGYEGQLTARGQDVTARGQTLNAAQAAAERATAGNRTRYDSVTGLLGKLY